jgi:hypothetical protein
MKPLPWGRPAIVGSGALFALALSVSLATTGCATHAGTPLPPPPPADRPALIVGDRWSLVGPGAGRIEDTYAGRRGNALLFHRAGYAKGSTSVATRYERLLTADLALIEGGGTENRPDDGALRFPLEVGKSWQHRYVRVLRRPKQQEFEVVVDAQVKSYERIIVPGGAFDAFRIESVSKTSSASVSSVRATYWYAPAAKAIVKYHAEQSAISPGLTATIAFELVELELKH